MSQQQQQCLGWALKKTWRSVGEPIETVHSFHSLSDVDKVEHDEVRVPVVVERSTVGGMGQNTIRKENCSKIQQRIGARQRFFFRLDKVFLLKREKRTS